MGNSTRIKICGIRTIEAAQVAVESGATLLGLVFYPPSPRYLSPDAAEILLTSINKLPTKPALVGLFVNISIEEMSQAAARYNLAYLQLSGDETPAQVAEISRVRPVIRALRLPAQVEAEEALRQAAPFGDLD